MKKRIGNDITFTWHIYRKDGDTQVPESFTGKDVEVKLISPLQRPVTIEDVTIATGVVTFTFRGKHQVTLGNYVAILQENRGEDGMVTLDVVSAVTLVPHSYMEEDGDEGDVIEAEAVELTSTISASGGGIEQQQADWAQTDDTAVDFIKNKPDLDVYCRKDADNTHSDSSDTYVKRVYYEQGALRQLDRLTVSGDSIKFFHSHRGEEIKELLLQLDDVEKIKRTATTELDGLMSAEDKGKLNDLPTATELAQELGGKQDTINDLAAIRSGAQAGATAYQMPATGIPATDLASAVQVSLGKADTALQEHQSLAELVNTGSYNTVSKKIELKHDNTVLAEIDATAFIKDGMVSSVTINNGYLVITFNTDAGKEPISIALTDIFNPANYYDKDDVDGLLAGKANKIPASPIIHELVVSGTTQVSDVITLITGRFEERPAESIQILGTFKNPSIIEFSVNYTGKLRFEGIRESVILKYIKAYVNGTLVETSTERIIDSEILSFNVEANDVVKVEFTIYNNTDYFYGCIGDLSITSTGVPKDLIDVYNSLAPVATSGSYNDLSDKPDLSAFITNSVDNLVNYYLKSETYTKTEVLQLIGAIQQFHYEVYPTLPQTGASNVLYLIGPTGSGSDKYEEYVYANNDWTKIGDTSIDLSGYVTTQALNTALADYVTSSALSTALANYYNKTEVDGLLASKADKSEMSVVPGTGANADKTTITLKQGTSATVLTTHQDISGKEDVTNIVTPVNATDATLPITTLSCEVGKYYRIDVAVDTLGVTLPAMTDLTTVRTVVICLTAGTTPAITISSSDSKDVYYQDGFEIEIGNTYEINALFNGAAWIVASVKINVE